MPSIVTELHKKGLIKSAPAFLSGGVQYEVIMGSMAYGVNTDASDMDIYGFCIPPRDYVFPHLRGEIAGFSTPGPQFEQYQEHHILDSSALGWQGREYDLAIYSIVKYFRLCMENNPNMIDSLFVPQRCVLFSSTVGNMVRENRKLFLHKGAWHKFKGYAFAQMRKLHTK
jgi:predicted nucleotidyltransferase